MTHSSHRPGNYVLVPVTDFLPERPQEHPSGQIQRCLCGSPVATLGPKDADSPLLRTRSDAQSWPFSLFIQHILIETHNELGSEDGILSRKTRQALPLGVMA